MIIPVPASQCPLPATNTAINFRGSTRATGMSSNTIDREGSVFGFGDAHLQIRSSFVGDVCTEVPYLSSFFTRMLLPGKWTLWQIHAHLTSEKRQAVNRLFAHRIC